MHTAPNGLKMLENVSVRVSVELGRTSMLLKDVLALKEDSVVGLDRLTDELLDVMVNGETIAKAEVIAQDNKFALRIVEITGSDAGPEKTVTEEQVTPQPANPAAEAI